MRTRLLLLATAWLLLLPAALAQGPEPYTLEIDASQAEARVSVERPTSVSFTVRFESQNPMDAQDPRAFQVALSGVPAGWTAAADPASFELAAGDTQAITVEVAVATGSETDEATLTVAVRLAPRGADPVPVLGPILDPEATAQTSVNLVREDGATRQVLEALDSWIWFVLIGVLVLAIVAAKLLVDARRIYVALHVPTPQITIHPGKSAAVPIRVENLGKGEDTVVFHVMKTEKGWSAVLPVPELDLDGGASEELQLLISAPRSAASGQEIAVGLSAHSAQAPRRIAEAVITARVE